MPENKKKINIFDLSGIDGLNVEGQKAEKEISSGVTDAEKEIEDLSFVKGTGKKDRNKDDPFAKLGL